MPISTTTQDQQARLSGRIRCRSVSAWIRHRSGPAQFHPIVVGDSLQLQAMAGGCCQDGGELIESLAVAAAARRPGGMRAWRKASTALLAPRLLLRCTRLLFISSLRPPRTSAATRCSKQVGNPQLDKLAAHRFLKGDGSEATLPGRLSFPGATTRHSAGNHDRRSGKESRSSSTAPAKLTIHELAVVRCN